MIAFLDNFKEISKAYERVSKERTEVQTCVFHLVGNSWKYIVDKKKGKYEGSKACVF